MKVEGKAHQVPLNYRRPNDGVQFKFTFWATLGGLCVGFFFGIELTLVAMMMVRWVPSLDTPLFRVLAAFGCPSACAVAGAILSNFRHRVRATKSYSEAAKTKISEDLFECPWCQSETWHTVRLIDRIERRVECQQCGRLETEIL